jgi:hypothetical protein
LYTLSSSMSVTCPRSTCHHTAATLVVMAVAAHWKPPVLAFWNVCPRLPSLASPATAVSSVEDMRAGLPRATSTSPAGVSTSGGGAEMSVQPE